MIFDVAEEAVQEAFAAALASRRVPACRFAPEWILQTARHKAIDRIRRKASWPRAGIVRGVERAILESGARSRCWHDFR